MDRAVSDLETNIPNIFSTVLTAITPIFGTCVHSKEERDSLGAEGWKQLARYEYFSGLFAEEMLALFCTSSKSEAKLSRPDNQNLTGRLLPTTPT